MSSHPQDQDSRAAQAVWFVAPRHVEVREETLAELGRDEVLVRAETSLVSAGTEMHVYHGRAGSPQAVDLPTTSGSYPFPLKFAYQLVGVVEQAGDDALHKPGARVFAMHPHQNRFIMPSGGGGPDDIMQGSNLLFSVPDGVTSDQAVFVNLFNVAYNALLDTPVRIGDVVVVTGLGVIGQFVAQLARRTASRLVLVDPLEQRRSRAEWIGADAVVHPSEVETVVAQLSSGRGADLWFEASGSPAALQSGVDNTGQEGTITVVSFYGDANVTLNLGLNFHLRRQRIVSSQVGAVGSGLQPRWDSGRRYDVAMEHLRRFDVSRLVSHRVSLADAADAYDLIDRRPGESLAVLLDY